MGKRIISQARGHGSLSYQAKKRAFIYKIKYPMGEGEAEILDIFHSAAHSAPLLKIQLGNQIFFNPAFNGAVVGQKIKVPGPVADGNILMLKDVPMGTHVSTLRLIPETEEK